MGHIIHAKTLLWAQSSWAVNPVVLPLSVVVPLAASCPAVPVVSPDRLGALPPNLKRLKVLMPKLVDDTSHELPVSSRFKSAGGEAAPLALLSEYSIALEPSWATASTLPWHFVRSIFCPNNNDVFEPPGSWPFMRV